MIASDAVSKSDQEESVEKQEAVSDVRLSPETTTLRTELETECLEIDRLERLLRSQMGVRTNNPKVFDYSKRFHHEELGRIVYEVTVGPNFSPDGFWQSLPSEYFQDEDLTTPVLKAEEAVKLTIALTVEPGVDWKNWELGDFSANLRQYEQDSGLKTIVLTDKGDYLDWEIRRTLSPFPSEIVDEELGLGTDGFS